MGAASEVFQPEALAGQKARVSSDFADVILLGGGRVALVLPVFWLLISEIYPLQVRGVAMSVATLTNWAFNLLVTTSFLTLVHGLGLSWTFWAYGLVSIGAWLFVKRFVPETKGRSLEQIEKEFTSGRKTVKAVSSD